MRVVFLPTLFLMRRAQSYFFGSGDFAISHAICRVVLGVCYLRILAEVVPSDWNAFCDNAARTQYHPVGILAAFGREMPSAGFFYAFHVVAMAATWMLIAGFLSRLSFIASTISVLVLTSLAWSFSDSWCHGQNVILLAGLAMMFGPANRFSVDGLLQRFVRRANREAETPRHRWPVLLGQIAVAVMFANACYWKLNQPGKPLGVWALSDNMYDIIHMQYWAIRRPMPWYLELVLSRSWSYQLMALGNLVTQVLPVVACFLIGRPILRALCGAGLLLEILALDMVMQISNPHWYLLFAFFVDWDRLAAWLSVRLGKEPGSSPIARPECTWSWRDSAAAAWIAMFLIAYFGVAFATKKQHWWTYPFTSWPMYCEIMVPAPYDEHLPCTLLGSSWSFERDTPVGQEYSDSLWRSHFNMPWAAGWDTRCDIVSKVQKETKSTRVSLAKTSFQVLPFPAQEVRPAQSAICCLLDHGVFRGLEVQCGQDVSNHKYFVELKPHGLQDPSFEFGYHLDGVADWRPLEIEKVGNRYYFTKQEKGAYWVSIRTRDARLGSEEIAFDGGAFR